MARSSELERSLDRYIGIPLIFLLGLIKRRNTLPNLVARVGVIQPTAVGDMILISGLLIHLRNCFPAAEIHVFHGASNAVAVKLLPVDVIAHKCDFKKPLVTTRIFRAAKLDILINCAPWTRITALLTALSGAKATVGYRPKSEYVHFAYDIAVPNLFDRHETENHLALANVFGPLQRYTLAVRDGVCPAIPGLAYQRLILVHVAAGGSRARQKSWLDSNWIELIKSLAKQGFVVGFTGTEADRQRVTSLINAAALPADQCFSLAGRLNLAELSYVLARARLLVTIDTGIAHLAAALNTAVVALHGPTRFKRWGACNARSIGLDAPHPAAGYINLGYEQHPQGDEIMATLSAGVVFVSILRELAKADVDQRAVVNV